jgi:hypothetical protein
VKNAWLEYQSQYPHVSAYFRSSEQYKNQISIVNGKKAGTENQSSEKYAYLHNQPLKQLLSAADTMLQLIIKVGSQDKRLLL